MATQRRKSSVQKRRSSMKRKYMKSRKLRGGLFGIFGKKAGEEAPAAEPEEAPAAAEKEGVLGNMMDTVNNMLPRDEGKVTEEDVKAVSGEEVEEGQAEKGPAAEEGPVEGGKKKKRKGTKKKKGTKKRKTAKKAKKSKKKKGKK